MHAQRHCCVQHMLAHEPLLLYTLYVLIAIAAVAGVAAVAMSSFTTDPFTSMQPETLFQVSSTA
jgi:hypothetical protein